MRSYMGHTYIALFLLVIVMYYFGVWGKIKDNCINSVSVIYESAISVSEYSPCTACIVAEKCNERTDNYSMVMRNSP